MLTCMLKMMHCYIFNFKSDVFYNIVFIFVKTYITNHEKTLECIFYTCTVSSGL